MSEQFSSPEISGLARWGKVARRIRVPLGFVVAALFLFDCTQTTPNPAAILWSLALVLPGLALRGISSGTVKKNEELTVTGPYAHTRNPLYLGSTLIAFGFAVALLSWLLALALGIVFAVIYVPVIASEERFLRATFPEFGDYCRQVPRFFPRLSPARMEKENAAVPVTSDVQGGFSMALYRKHREYNSAIGAALLYMSLFYLRPLLQFVLHGLH